MRSAAASLMIFAVNALAHDGHGAPAGHFHWAGIEHAVLLLAVVALLAYAVRK